MKILRNYVLKLILYLEFIDSIVTFITLLVNLILIIRNQYGELSRVMHVSINILVGIYTDINYFFSADDSDVS